MQAWRWPWDAAARRPAEIDEPPVALMAICAIAIALVGGTFSNRLKTWKPMPTDALAFMQQHSLHGNLLPTVRMGRVRAWHMGDAFKVYIDPRGELVYHGQAERQTTRFFSTGWTARISCSTSYPHDYVLMGVHDQGRRRRQERPALASTI